MEKVRTLLADDHEVVRSGIRNALTAIAVLEIVGEVANGPELRSALADGTQDLLILDVTMPDFEPIGEIAEIRAAHPALKILVVSAYDDDVYVQGLLGVGVDGYHLKDQPLSDLRLAVERVLAGEKWVSSRLVNKLIRYRNDDTTAVNPPPNENLLVTQNGVRLTARQSEIMGLLHQGLDNNSIARRMNLSIKTVENHLTRLYRQLNVQSRMQAVSLLRQAPPPASVGRHDQPPAKPLSQAPSEPSPITTGQLTILLVDDNERYRGQLRRMVGKASDHALVHEAGTVAEASALVTQENPTLALVDVVMGDEDGIECTRRLKEISPSLRIVLITAYPDREFHRRGLEAGAVALIDKKILDTPTLRQVIEDSM